MSATFQEQKEQEFVDAGTSDQTLRLALRVSKTKISTLCIPIWGPTASWDSSDQVVMALAFSFSQRRVSYLLCICVFCGLRPRLLLQLKKQQQQQKRAFSFSNFLPPICLFMYKYCSAHFFQKLSFVYYLKSELACVACGVTKKISFIYSFIHSFLLPDVCMYAITKCLVPRFSYPYLRT